MDKIIYISSIRYYNKDMIEIKSYRIQGPFHEYVSTSFEYSHNLDENYSIAINVVIDMESNTYRLIVRGFDNGRCFKYAKPIVHSDRFNKLIDLEYLMEYAKELNPSNPRWELYSIVE